MELACSRSGGSIASTLLLSAETIFRNVKTPINPSYELKVTIIVPTYTGTRYIASRLDSACKQNYLRDKIEITTIDSTPRDDIADRVRE